MSHKTSINVYVTDEERTRIEREADRADMSLSRYILSGLEDKWTREDTEATAERVEIEERVERIASNATDEMAAMIEQQQQRTEQMVDMAARSAVYSIANFELLKLTQKPPEAARTKSLQIGSRRLRDPFDPNADANATLPIESSTHADGVTDDEEEEIPDLDDDFFERTG